MSFDTSIYIYGTHAVGEALQYAPHAVLSVSASGQIDPALGRLAKSAGIAIKGFDPKKMPQGIPGDAVHQGVIAKISTKELAQDYKEFIDKLDINGSGRSSSSIGLVVLGEVQDPQNVGAVIRSAAAFGISGVLIPEHRQAGISGTVVKVSAGMAFRVPLVQIKNVNSTIRDLKERGFWVYGLAGESEQSLSDETFDRPSVFVLGNEGKGIREKTREVCDILLRIPQHERCESLNASASAAVALYAWSTQHPEALE